MIYLIIGFIAMIVLEYFLSKLKSPVWGLLLPCGLFITTLLMLVTAVPDPTVNIVQRIAQIGYAMLYYNLPTIVLIVIYLCIRGKNKDVSK